MTKISLRVYNREVEAMIESGQVDEAIAHCQYILKTFPMHLETYRLLGKAFLETRRYSDAADIFQRVLNSVPEDFVSHVGMSIIRDDENKLDEAIWHMERAFEVQPSNPAIQDELRKLYGRRDGVQPPKVRLTRDALANMYAQGALYSQAIAEIRAVLADDPNRPDLQVMLARAYSKDGRKKQAIEICTELLKTYPYCFDALRTFIDLMPPGDQHEFTQTYRLRVKALDPYAGFVTGSMFNSDNVPDAAVNLELLDYDPNDLERRSQPAWASSLGIKLKPEEEQQDVPEWLSEKTIEIQPEFGEDNLAHALEGESEASSDVLEVPDWMRSSGWEKNTDNSADNSVSDDTEIENEEPIAKAEIPEWLKEMAPDEELLESDKLPDGLEALLDVNSINSPLQDKFIDNEHESGLLEALNEKGISEEVVPDWMKNDEINNQIQIEKESTEISSKMEPNQDIFKTLSSEEPLEQSLEGSSQPADDISSWLGDVKRDAIDSGNESNEIKENDDDLPGWLKDIGSEKKDGDLDLTNEPIGEIQSQSEEIFSAIDQIDPKQESPVEDDLPEWLKNDGMGKQVDDLDISNEPIVEIQGQSEGFSSVGDQTDSEQEETAEEDLPEWLKNDGLEKQIDNLHISNEPIDEIQDHSEVFYSSAEDQTDPELEATAEEDLPEWLKNARSEKQVDDLDISYEPFGEIQDQSEMLTTTVEKIDIDKKSATEDDLPDWLNEIELTLEGISPNDELASTLGAGEEISSLIDEEITPPELESIPELEGLGYKDEIQVPTSEDTTLKVESKDDGLPSMEDQDAAMAWLESLAARQGAKPEELLTKPEDRLEEPPEWVKNSIEDDLNSVEDEANILFQSEPELIDFRKTEETVSIIEEETEGSEKTGGDEQTREFIANEQEELVEGKVIGSPDLVNFPETTTKDEPEYPLEFDESNPDVQSSSLVEELPLEEGPQTGLPENQEFIIRPESEIDPSADTDISKWLSNSDASDTNTSEPIAPKVSEFYGNEITEPIPDWLKDMEKEASSSEWISESEALPEQIKESNELESIPGEKDIDDIGEIFPTDSSNWNFEDSESEPELEPLGDVVKPVSSGEWQPIQPEQTPPAEEIKDISKTVSALHSNESPQVSKPPGPGMLSKIPARDIEKEAGTLERAQSFIESGELKKAIEVYTRLVKKGQLLEGVIHDLRETTYRYPLEIGIWQLLGDAYMRANRLQDALDAYTKAEELLH